MALTAVIDRFEGDLAVVLVGEREETLHVPADALPGDCQQGDVLTVTLAVDREETNRRRQRIQAKINRLKSNGNDG